MNSYQLTNTWPWSWEPAAAQNETAAAAAPAALCKAPLQGNKYQAVLLKHCVFSKHSFATMCGKTKTQKAFSETQKLSFSGKTVTSLKH